MILNGNAREKRLLQLKSRCLGQMFGKIPVKEKVKYQCGLSREEVVSFCLVSKLC